MERKDYEEKIRDIKDEILDEIRWISEYGVKHNFKETFYVNYVKGEVFCTALEVNGRGMITFHVINDVGEKEKIDGEDVYTFDPNSFIDILDHLKKDIREEKLAILREIVKKNEGSIDFDGTFDITIHNTGEDFICKLTALRITKDGKLEVDNTFHGGKCTNEEYELSDKGLDKLIAYVENNTKKKFKIRAYETFSRIFEIEATNYDEAVEKICKELESFPFEEGDSDGLCFN